MGGSECVRGACVCVPTLAQLLTLHKNVRRWRSDGGLLRKAHRDDGRRTNGRNVENKRSEAEIPFIGNFNSYSMFYILQ